MTADTTIEGRGEYEMRREEDDDFSSHPLKATSSFMSTVVCSIQSPKKLYTCVNRVKIHTCIVCI